MCQRVVDVERVKEKNKKITLVTPGMFNVEQKNLGTLFVRWIGTMSCRLRLL